jgi:hypothetical protein
MLVTPAVQITEVEGSLSRPPWAKIRDPSLKITKAKRAGNMAPVVEYLPSKC